MGADYHTAVLVWRTEEKLRVPSLLGGFYVHAKQSNLLSHAQCTTSNFAREMASSVPGNTGMEKVWESRASRSGIT